jgi:hypothetical protein
MNQEHYRKLLSMAAGVLEGIGVLEKAWSRAGTKYFSIDQISIASGMSKEMLSALLPAMKVAGLVRNPSGHAGPGRKWAPSPGKWGRAK